MSGGFWRKNGAKRGARLLATTHLSWLWLGARKTPLVSSRVNRWLIDSSVYSMQTRPPALSTKSDYPSWDSLNDRRYSSRHLKSADGFAPATAPADEFVATLFERPAGSRRRSSTSSLLFPLFAQWFVDGFLRTDPQDPRKNTSTHDIDLSQLYGQTPDVTDKLREKAGGRLRFQIINGQMFPPYFFDDNGNEKDEFKGLPITFHSTDLKARGLDDVHDERRRKLFALGIPRGNIHYGFAMLSTLFLREHNRIAREIAASNSGPEWDDERVFQTARNTLIAVLINVVIEDYINHITPIKFPLFVEPGIGVSERWYRQNWMSVEFNLLYRWHSLVPSRVTVGGTERLFSDLSWDTRPVTEYGVAALIDEASAQPCSTISLLNTDTDLLRIEQKSMGVARTNRLASYNDYRVRCGMPRLGSIEDLSADKDVRGALRSCYADIDAVEFFPGLFAEDVRRGSTLPPLMATMVAVDAFSQALTNPLLAPGVYGADTFSAAGLKIVEGPKTLSDIVHRNTKGESTLPRVSLGWSRRRR